MGNIGAGDVAGDVIADGQAGIASKTYRSAVSSDRSCPQTPYGWLVLATVWAASALYLLAHLKRGWVPADAGLFAQMAERVLRGQVPYRDFIEIYTGGLTYLDAAALRLFGDNLFSQRIPLFLFFLGWVPAVYFIARRFAGPTGAGLITLLSVAWSVPNYPEAMPSWYNLFFATWGMLALFRYIKTEKRRWLWIAGLCAGLSFLVKMVALYFIAAALLFFVFRELSRSAPIPPGQAHAGTPYRVFASASLLAFLAVLVDLVFQRPTGANFFYFVLPGACLVAMLLWAVWRTPSAESWPRFCRLFSMTLPFLGGALAPVVLFLAFLAKAGALRAWALGMLHASVRLQWLAYPMVPPLLAILGIAPFAAILALGYYRSPRVRRWTALAAVLFLFGCLVISRLSPPVYIVTGTALPVLIPLLSLFALAKMSGTGTTHARRRECVFLLVAVAGLCSLIQYPQGRQIYFSYVAPLAFLALLGLLLAESNSSRFTLMAVAAFYLVFAVWLGTPAFFATTETPAFFSTNGKLFRYSYSLVPLNVPRSGGLLVSRRDAIGYEKLMPVIEAHAHGAYIYCTPDCPEVYFLSGKLNPTPTLDDFLDPDFLNVPERTARILSTLDDHMVSLVVLNDARLLQSGQVPPGLRAALDAKFPNSKTVGQFAVRWK